MNKFKEGTIIVFNENSPRIRPELRGCKAEFTKDYEQRPGNSAHLHIMDGRFQGRNMQGSLEEKDFSLFIKNKGKEN